MKVYLVRHGKAVDKVIDPERPLSKEGKEEVKKIAGFLEGKNLKVSEIWCSKKLRAKQTAEVFKEILFRNIEIFEKDSLSPNSPAEIIFDELKNKNTDILITGHLPHLSRLFSLLLSGEEKDMLEFPSSGIICLGKIGDNFKLLWFLSPEII